VDALVDSSSVVPMDILGDDGTELSFVPDQNPVQQLSAQGADETLDMRVGLSCRMHPMWTLRNDVSG